MPRDIARGIASVKRFVRQQSIKGVHGTLIELIECSNRLHTAIEVLSPSRASAPSQFLQPPQPSYLHNASAAVVQKI